MRVLHVSSYFAPAFVYGGPPRSIFELCKALQDTDVQVEVFTTTANGNEELPASADPGSLIEGVRVRYFPRAFPRRYFGASGMGRALRGGIEGFDLVHVHGLWNAPGWLAIRECRKRRVPYVVSPRGMLDPGSFAYHRFRKAICYWLQEKENLKGAAMLHATSTGEAASLSRLGLGTRVAVLPNGVNLPPVVGHRDFRPRVGLPEGAPLVVFLGRLHPIKRLDLLLHAFRAVQGEFPDAILVLAGRADGLDPESLAGEQLGREVRWLGPLPEAEKWELLSEASALVMCSDSESFGLSVLEALAAGVPVVVSRTCPWQEVSERGCGFWVEQDAQELASGIRRILADPAAARQMGERGRQLVMDCYRWPAIAREMTRHYASAIDALPVTRRRAS